MQRFICTGNLTRDPQLRETMGGVKVCNFDIAVKRDFANADGERETDFFNITTWRNTAESCVKYLKKGSKVGIVGTLQNRSYEDKNGYKRTVTEVVADTVEFLTPKDAGKPERQPLEELKDNQLPF